MYPPAESGNTSASRSLGARRSATNAGKLTVRANSDAFGDTLYTQPADFDVADRVNEVAAARGVSSAQVALAFGMKVIAWSQNLTAEKCAAAGATFIGPPPAVLDAFVPGIGDWEGVYDSPTIWHFRFNGPTPEALVKGRERTYFEFFWNDFAADKTHSLPEADRVAYAAAYARPGRMHAGWQYFVSFQQAAKDFAELSKTKLTMPVMAIGASNSLGNSVPNQVRQYATDVTGVVFPDSGHWIYEEHPAQSTKLLLGSLG